MSNPGLASAVPVKRVRKRLAALGNSVLHQTFPSRIGQYADGFAIREPRGPAAGRRASTLRGRKQRGVSIPDGAADYIPAREWMSPLYIPKRQPVHPVGKYYPSHRVSLDAFP